MGEQVYDGYLSFQGGQNEGNLPDRIGEDQVKRAINCTFANGAIAPRPGYRSVRLMFEDMLIEGRTIEQVFKTGKFQALAPYRAEHTGWILIAIISGIIFRIDPVTFDSANVTVQSVEDGSRLNQFVRRYNWTQAGRFFVIFDYPNSPILIDGDVARRSNIHRMDIVAGVPLPKPEVFPSVLGLFIGNRLWVTNQVHEFTAGDPVGGINSDAPITFEEVLVQSSPFYKQAFSLGFPNSTNPITALAMLQLPDTSTGIGPLIVSTEDTIFYAPANTTRDKWDTTTFTTVLIFRSGIIAQRAGVNMNSDFVYVSRDKAIRAISTTRNAQQRWSNAPISKEVSPFLNMGDTELLDTCFASTHLNKIFFGAAPYRVAATSLQGDAIFDEAHTGLLVLELDNVSSLGTSQYSGAPLVSSSSPVWAGLWTGLRPMEVTRISQETYIMSKDFGNINRLYVLDSDISWDIFEDKEVDIPARVYTRDMVFGKPFMLKKEQQISYSFANISGQFLFSAARKRSVDSSYIPWGSYSYEAKSQSCRAELELSNVVPHGIQDLNLGGAIQEACDPLTEQNYSSFKKLGLRLDIRARSWRLDNLNIRAEGIPESLERTVPCDNIVIENIAACEIQDDIDMYYLSRDYGN